VGSDGRVTGRTVPVGAFAAALALAVLANLFAAAYVSAEHYIYYWDFSLYWKKFGQLGQMLQTDIVGALVAVMRSIATENYTALPILPMAPFGLVFGDGRMSYILAIANIALLPSAVLIAWIVESRMQHRSWVRFFLCLTGVLCVHVLWAPTLRGFPDVLGVAIACIVLLAYFGKAPEDQKPMQLALIGLLLCLLILTRRWYLFWVVSFFPAAVIAYLAGSPREQINSKAFWGNCKALIIVAQACFVFLAVLAAPLVARMASTDYSTAYAAYRPDLANAGQMGQVVAHFGLALLAACTTGLVWLIKRPETRALGVFLVVQAGISLALFMRVQGLLGVQHFLLLAPTLGVGLASAISAFWNARMHLAMRAGGIGVLFCVVVASSVAVLSPTPVASGPFLPVARYAPLVRPDLAEVERLMSAIEALKPHRIYVAASSDVLNWDTLAVACRDRHPALCSRVARTADIDARDGYPRGILNADLVVLASPTQYHVRPEDQQVVGLLARDVRQRQGIGSSFEALPGEFQLMRGVRAQIYRRVADTRDVDAKALSNELKRSYPDLGNIMDYDLDAS